MKMNLEIPTRSHVCQDACSWTLCIIMSYLITVHSMCMIILNSMLHAGIYVTGRDSTSGLSAGLIC